MWVKQKAGEDSCLFEALCRVPKVREVAYVNSGGFDYLVKIVAPTIEDVADIHYGTIRKMKGIEDTLLMTALLHRESDKVEQTVQV